MSALNCKPGDLAIVVAPRNGKQCICTGRICHVVRAAIAGHPILMDDGLTMIMDADDAACWVIKYPTSQTNVSVTGATKNSFYDLIWDSRLRPIRDQPGDDETLTWAGLPNKQKVAA